MIDLSSVDAGFSRKAKLYDDYCENHPVIRWARDTVRQGVRSKLKTGDAILELNAGTGSDAAYFVANNYRVHATDFASGMVSAIKEKISISEKKDQFTTQQISFTDLDYVIGAPFDLVFSNLGGLNCIPDLGMVTKFLSRLLKPGGHVVWVVMPPFCPWELSLILRGKFRVATRRFNPNGVLANIEGVKVRTWYHSSKKVVEAFGSEFQLVKKQSLSLFCPPSYMDRFPHRFPNLTKILLHLDDRFGDRYPFHNWGDFVAYTFRYG